MGMRSSRSNLVVEVGSELFWKRFLVIVLLKSILFGNCEANRTKRCHSGGPCRSRFRKSKICGDQDIFHRRILEQWRAGLARDKKNCDESLAWFERSFYTSRRSFQIPKLEASSWYPLSSLRVWLQSLNWPYRHAVPAGWVSCIFHGRKQIGRRK